MRLVARLALLATLLVAMLLVALAFTFPTDAIVRRAVALAMPPGGPTLTFARATLRPWGLRLDDVSLRNPDGTVVAAADWLRLQPSIMGFLRDRTGRPWYATGGACGGSIEAVVSGEGAASVLRLDWRDLELSSCALVPSAADLAGRSEGTATLTLARDSPIVGEGSANLRSARLRAADLRLPLEALHADPASVRWTLAGDKITLSTIEMQGPELRVSGSGTVRLAGSLADSALNLRLVVTPGPDAPPTLRQALANLPPARDAPGARLLYVVGTINDLRRLMGRA
jgi:type II secretion system protein N